MLDRYKRNREQLVLYLKKRGIVAPNVLNAIATVERHRFVESYLADRAYLDEALPILYGQTISQPSTVAFQSQLLKIRGKEKVLEIGTGSGYQAAILSAMGAKVYSVERNMELYRWTRSKLEDIDCRIILHYGDGFAGWSDYSPYDRIIVTCGAPEIPVVLLAQLKEGGKMVVPVGEEAQIMKRITNLGAEGFQVEDFGDFKFVPMLDNVVSFSNLNS